MKRTQVICNFCDADITGQTRVSLRAQLVVSAGDADKYEIGGGPLHEAIGKSTREMDVCIPCVDRLLPGLTEQGLGKASIRLPTGDLLDVVPLMDDGTLLDEEPLDEDTPGLYGVEV